MKASRLAAALAFVLGCAHANEPVATIPVESGDPEASPKGEGPTVLEDLVVTATKREQLIQDIPASVSAISGDTLSDLGAQGMADFLKLIPGVVYNDQGAESGVPSIRGIATETGFGSTAQTTGVFLDDIPFSDFLLPLSLPDPHPFDMERVEVLKGPQGTLFGSGALAGAVRYITRKPELGSGSVELQQALSHSESGGSVDHTTALAANAPLDERVALRFAGSVRNEGGLYDKGATDTTGTSLRQDADADRVDQWSARALAKWQPADNVWASGYFLAQETQMDDSAFADQPATPSSTTAPFASPRSYAFSAANISLTYEGEDLQLHSTSNPFTKQTRVLNHSEWLFDLQTQDQNEFYDLAISDIRGLTQELRLSTPAGWGRWTWLIGLSYMTNEAEYTQYEPNPGPRRAVPDDPRSLSTIEKTQSFLFAAVDSDSTESALFGEATVALTGQWALTAGIRAYETRMLAQTVVSGSQAAALTQQSENRAEFELESRGFNPKLALRYSPAEAISIYALAAKGFQFGGVQVNPSAPVLEQSAEDAGFRFEPYRSSSLWNYEIGLRSSWLSDRLKLDLTAFYLDWTDLQLTVRVPISGTAATFGLIANVGEAHSQGLEASVAVIPFAGARLASSAAFISARTDVAFDEDNSAGPVPAGTRLPGTPRLHWSNVAEYAWDIPRLQGWSLGPSLVHTHFGSAPDAIRQTDTVGSYDTLDALLALRRRGDRSELTVSLGVQNATDERASTYHLRLASVTGTPHDFYHLLPPRTYVLNLGFRY